MCRAALVGRSGRPLGEITLELIVEGQVSWEQCSDSETGSVKNPEVGLSMVYSRTAGESDKLNNKQGGPGTISKKSQTGSRPGRTPKAVRHSVGFVASGQEVTGALGRSHFSHRIITEYGPEAGTGNLQGAPTGVLLGESAPNIYKQTVHE